MPPARISTFFDSIALFHWQIGKFLFDSKLANVSRDGCGSHYSSLRRGGRKLQANGDVEVLSDDGPKRYALFGPNPEIEAEKLASMAEELLETTWLAVACAAAGALVVPLLLHRIFFYKKVTHESSAGSCSLDEYMTKVGSNWPVGPV
jgi:hypothetical protein